MEQPIIGFYGKIPAHGDFIDRQLPLDFIRHWDDWLQQGIATSRERLGDAWLNLYLTSPIWRFMLSPGALDKRGWAGIVTPSVDSVGRYFPLTIATDLPSQTGLAVFCQQNDSWFKKLESVALGALQEGLDADKIAHHLLQVQPPSPNRYNGLVNSNSTAVQSSTMESALATQLDMQIAQNFESRSLWFSIYTEPPMQNLLLAQGMPTAEQYTAMIDNRWQQWGWGVNSNSTEAPLQQPYPA